MLLTADMVVVDVTLRIIIPRGVELDGYYMIGRVVGVISAEESDVRTTLGFGEIVRGRDDEGQAMTATAGQRDDVEHEGSAEGERAAGLEEERMWRMRK